MATMTMTITVFESHTKYYFVETEINTPPENTFIADQNGTFIFSIRLSCAKL